jgi:hypothetical protein
MGIDRNNEKETNKNDSFNHIWPSKNEEMFDNALILQINRQLHKILIFIYSFIILLNKIFSEVNDINILHQLKEGLEKIIVEKININIFL